MTNNEYDRLYQILIDTTDRLSKIIDVSENYAEDIREIASHELKIYTYFLKIIPLYFDNVEGVDEYCNILLHCDNYDFLTFINDNKPIPTKEIYSVLYRIKNLIETLKTFAK